MAVFIALGVGLLIGSTMMVRDTLLEKQQQLILRMESDFTKLRQEKRDLQAQGRELEDRLSSKKETIEEILTLFLEDTLTHVKIFLDNERGVDLDKTDLLNLLSLTGVQLVNPGDDYHEHLSIGDGDGGGEETISLSQEELYLPHLLVVIMELMRDYEGRESQGLNPSL